MAFFLIFFISIRGYLPAFVPNFLTIKPNTSSEQEILHFRLFLPFGPDLFTRHDLRDPFVLIFWLQTHKTWRPDSLQCFFVYVRGNEITEQTNFQFISLTMQN